MYNLDESIRLYAITLQAQISLENKASKGYFKNFQAQKIIDPSSRKEMILRKIDAIEQQQDEILKILPKFHSNNIENLIFEFEKKSNNVHSELEQILNEMTNNNVNNLQLDENLNAGNINNSSKKKKIDVDRAPEIFSMINCKEKNLEGLSIELNNYKIFYKINKKIDETYKTLEKALDDIIKKETFSDENFLKLKNKSLNNDNLNFMYDSDKSFDIKNNISNIIKKSLKISKEKENSVQNKLKLEKFSNPLSSVNSKLKTNNRINIEAKEKKNNYENNETLKDHIYSINNSNKDVDSNLKKNSKNKKMQIDILRINVDNKKKDQVEIREIGENNNLHKLEKQKDIKNS